MYIGLLSVCTTGHYDGSLVSNSKQSTFQAIQKFVDLNSNETLFYLFIVCVNKCGGSDPNK